MLKLNKQPWWEPGIVVWALRRSRLPDSLTQSAAGLAAFAAGVCGEHYKLWEVNPARSLGEWWIEVLTFFAFSLVATSISLARENVKLTDTEELITAKAVLAAKDQQLSSWINTSALIRQIIKQKQQRLQSIVEKKLNLGRAIVEIWNRSEPELILRIIHDQFKLKFNDIQFRIALFARSNNPCPHLTPLYSYDGNSKECVTIDPENYRLDSDNATKAEVSKHYLSGEDHSFKVIEDCVKADNFAFFHVDQRNYVRSMLIFKHRAQGLNDTLVLSLDCDRPGFFTSSMTESYNHLIVEMMHRLEYQLLVLQVRDSIKMSRPTRAQGESK